MDDTKEVWRVDSYLKTIERASVYTYAPINKWMYATIGDGYYIT